MKVWKCYLHKVDSMPDKEIRNKYLKLFTERDKELICADERLKEIPC